MFELPSQQAQEPEHIYRDVLALVASITDGEHDLIANLANAASVMYHLIPNVNWAGFYLLRDGELVLGPFHGKPACIRIALGRGVCGTAARDMRTLVVDDVHQFPGHIACDAASASEIVIPMIKDENLVGVLDIDSPLPNRFTEEDRIHLEKVVELLMSRSKE